MGKLSCSICKKSCKDEAVKYDDKYYHSSCFICQECGIQLSTDGFYKNGEQFYCHDDYQKLFGKKCHLCKTFIEGEVFTALDLIFHKACFSCFSCSKPLEPGNKVTFVNNSFLCVDCFQSDDNINEDFKKATFIQESETCVENISRYKDQDCNVDYGKFYKKSFLEQTTSPFKKAASINASDVSPRHYHRPDNFSYTQVARDFIKPPKRESSIILHDLESEIALISKATKPSMGSVVVSISNREPVRLSKLPDAQLKARTDLKAFDEEDGRVNGDEGGPVIEKTKETDNEDEIDDSEKKDIELQKEGKVLCESMSGSIIKDPAQNEDVEIDPITGLKRLDPNPAFAVYSSLNSMKPSLLDLFKKEQIVNIYPYEELKFANFKLPLDVERSSVERHLSEVEFKKLFRMNKREFYELAEWRRNDIKKKLDLY